MTNTEQVDEETKRKAVKDFLDEYNKLIENYEVYPSLYPLKNGSFITVINDKETDIPICEIRNFLSIMLYQKSEVLDLNEEIKLEIKENLMKKGNDAK